MTDARSRTSKGGLRWVSHLTVGFAIWLGIPVLALIWANLNLWRARRFLKQLRQPAPKPWSANTAADGKANASTAAMEPPSGMTAVPVATPISSQ